MADVRLEHESLAAPEQESHERGHAEPHETDVETRYRQDVDNARAAERTPQRLVDPLLLPEDERHQHVPGRWWGRSADRAAHVGAPSSEPRAGSAPPGGDPDERARVRQERGGVDAAAREVRRQVEAPRICEGPRRTDA